ncbi:hypothetical protein D5086_033681 [Populus alba]|uniref:Uncharacterized protein n=1 Tax=Populus alba TaxID=43335 RepID=A0ACC4AHL0_POPAL
MASSIAKQEFWALRMVRLTMLCIVIISEIINRCFPMSIFAFQQYENDLADIEGPRNKLARQQPQVTEVS